MLSPRNEGLQAAMGLHLAHFCNCLPRKSWASLRCCPEASEPHQVCGQNQTQPVQKAASLPLFTYIKKATAVSVLHAVLEPWVSLLRTTASHYKTGFELLFFSFPQSWPFLIYWNAGRSSDNHKNILFEAISPGFVAVKLDRQFCYSCAEF